MDAGIACRATAHHFDHFYEQHKPLAQIPTLLDMLVKMMNGAEILTPTMKQEILTDNAQALLQL